MGTCAIGGYIAAGASYTCPFFENVTGVAGSSQTDTVTAAVIDANATTASNVGFAIVTITASG